MEFLALSGVLLTVVGLGGLSWCIIQGLRIRRAKLPPEDIHDRLHRLVALNLGSVALAALGLAMLVAGLLL